MVVRNKENRRPQIDLDGPAGNVFPLISNAGMYAKQLGLDAKAIQAEMIEHDYYHALITFEKYFGEYVDLLTTDEHILALLSK